ncbi:MAG: hypothetical protein ACYSXF_09540, partial [Planctomycetota bacterium]
VGPPGQGLGPPSQAVALDSANNVVYRMFSDGTVERNVRLSDPVGDPCDDAWCGWEVVPE